MTEHQPVLAAEAPAVVDISVRSPAQRSRTFGGILMNTGVANITTS